MMKSRRHRENIVVLVLCFYSILFLSGCTKKISIVKAQEKKIAQQSIIIKEQERKITCLEEEQNVLFFSIEAETDGYMEIHYEFPYDPAKDYQINLKGKELFINCWQIPLSEDNKYCFLPYSFFSNSMKPSDGTLIIGDYMDTNGFPKLYQENNFSDEDALFLKKICRTIQSNPSQCPDPRATGHALHEMPGSPFIIGDEYEIIVHSVSGTPEVRENENE
jgi:hypothetical protein